MGPDFEAVTIDESTMPYIANHTDIPISDLQAAYEYARTHYRSTLYFVRNWKDETQPEWMLLTAFDFRCFFRFVGPEKPRAFQHAKRNK